jgi:hypothetical protein
VVPRRPANEYITLYITTGFGRLRHLGVRRRRRPAVKSLTRLDAWIDEQYREILKRGKKGREPSVPTIALYLYGRSFFLEDKPIDAKHQGGRRLLPGPGPQVLAAAGQPPVAGPSGHRPEAVRRRRDAARIMRRSRSVRSATRNWACSGATLELSWWWYRAPIETQAMMIEAFDEVMNDAQAVEDCKVWLLKQKQTQDWKTTKATADAVYALLLRGTDLLASDELVEVTLGGRRIEPENVEAGTGFYEQR